MRRFTWFVAHDLAFKNVMSECQRKLQSQTLFFSQATTQHSETCCQIFGQFVRQEILINNKFYWLVKVYELGIFYVLKEIVTHFLFHSFLLFIVHSHCLSWRNEVVGFHKTAASIRQIYTPNMDSWLLALSTEQGKEKLITREKLRARREMVS